MPTNDFLPFANDSGANVISQADWLALQARITGWQAGLAESAKINKAMRQASVMSAALAEYICNTSGVDMLDNSNFSEIVTKLTNALNAGNASGAAAGVPVRLTLSQGVAVPDSDISGATTVYMTPIGGNSLALWNGSVWAGYPINSDVALVLDAAGHVANGNYSVFAFQVGGAVNIGTGPAWSSTVSPGAGAGTAEVELYQGRLVNRYAITLRNNSSTFSVPARQALLVGGFHVGSIAGQVSDTLQYRHLSNVYNQTVRSWSRNDPAASWVIPQISVYRQANANALNQVEYFRVVGGSPIRVDVNGVFTNDTTTGRTTAVGIGIDSVTVNSATLRAVMTVAQTPTFIRSSYEGNPGIGFHYISWLELTGTNDNRTCYGNGLALGSPVDHRSGMIGSVLN